MDIKAQISQIAHSKNFKHGMLYTVFSFVNSGISFILLLVLARYLTPADYGYLNLFTTFVTLLNIIISLCTVSYVAVSFFQKAREELRKIVLIALMTTTGMLMLLSLTMLIIPAFVEKSVGVPIEYLWLGLMICYFQVFNNLNLDIWRLEEKPVSYGIYGVSFAVCNFALTFWLIVGLHYGWQGRVYAWSLLAVIYFIVSIVFLIKRRYLVFTLPSKSLFKETYIYAIPLIPHTASFWLKSGLDRYIINYFHNQSVVGYFSFAANLAAIITIIGTAFNATNSVYIYKKLVEGYEKVKSVLSKQTNIMTILFFGISLLVMILSRGLMSFLLPKYQDSVSYILPLCLGSFFQCIYLLWVNYLFFYKKTKLLMNITLSTALLQVLLSLWLTRYGAIFTAWISCIIMILTFVLIRYFSKHAINDSLNDQKSENILIAATVYSLFLYLLISPLDKLKSTVYILGYDLSKSFKNKLTNVTFIDKTKFYGTSKIKRILYKIYLYHIQRKKFIKKNSIIYGSDHMPYSAGLVGKGPINVIEDGLANYNDELIYVGKHHNWLKKNIYPILYGPLSVENCYGGSKYVQSIYLTGLKEIPEILKKKVKLIDLKNLWNFSDELKKEFILTVFNVKPRDIELYRSKNVILFTQPYNTIICDEDLIKIYKNSLAKFKDSEILIKTHPRDTINYKSVFSNIEVFTDQVPMELFNLLGIEFEYAITISSTVIYTVNSKNKIVLGWDVHPNLKTNLGHLKI